jgi:hypothetical protein
MDWTAGVQTLVMALWSFSSPNPNGLWGTQPPSQWVPDASAERNGRNVKLTTDIHLVPRCKILRFDSTHLVMHFMRDTCRHPACLLCPCRQKKSSLLWIILDMSRMSATNKGHEARGFTAYGYFSRILQHWKSCLASSVGCDFYFVLKNNISCPSRHGLTALTRNQKLRVG